MRKACSLFAVLASMALLAAPAAQAQSSQEKAPPKAAAAAPAAKPAAKPADGKATKVEGATAVRTAPADLKRSSEKDYDGCGHGKMAASDA
jgi:hypothetical protein